MLKCLFGIYTRELLDTATKKQRLHMNICPEEAPRKKNASALHQWAAASLVFLFTMQIPNGTRGSKQVTGSWLIPQRQKKKTVVTGAGCVSHVLQLPRSTTRGQRFIRNRSNSVKNNRRAKPGKQLDRVLWRGGEGGFVGWKCLSVFCILSVCVPVVVH